MSIVKDCMIVNLHFSAWDGRRLDKEESRVVTERNNMVIDAMSVTKRLIDSKWLDGVNKSRNAIYTHFMSQTMPWKDNGDRVLTRMRYLPFMEAHAKLVANWDMALHDFFTKGYPTALEQAEFRMGARYDPDDYPTVNELRKRFKVKLVIDAVAEAGDFRVTLDAEERQHIQSQMEVDMAARLNRAMGDVWKRLSVRLERFADRMTDDASGKKIFRDSVVDNLREIVDVLPDMNILNDPELARLGREIEGHLLGYDAETLRKKDKERAQVATSATSLLEELNDYIASMGGVAVEED